jgi:drug/metabolite transporter (DMT)-like permease
VADHQQPTPTQIGFILIVGVFAVSTAAIFIRLAIAAADERGLGFSLFLSAFRLLVASLVLLPTWRNLQPNPQAPAALYYAGAAGVCLSCHFVAWITSLSFTSIAASTTLVTTNPIWVSLISWLWFREKPTRTIVLGIAIAFAGGVLIAFGDAGSDVGDRPLLGNSLALLGAILASLYLLLGREAQRRGLGIGRYAAIAYSTGALVLLPLPPLAGSNYIGYLLTVYLYTVLMAVVSQAIGHTAFNWSVRWVSPILITLALLFEPVGSSLLGYVVFGEAPGLPVLLGAVVVLVGVAVSLF